MDQQPDTPGSRPSSLSMMLVAFFLFACMDTGAKWLVTAGMLGLQVSFLRYAVHFLSAVAVYAPREGLSIFRARQPLLQSVRGLMLFTATVFNFTALQYLPLNITIAMFNAAPIVVCLLGMLFLKEQVGIRRLLAVGVGFVGVLLIVDPWGETFDWHILLSFGALAGFSGYLILNRALAFSDSNAVSQIYTSGLATVFLLPVAVSQWIWPETAVDWLVVVMLGSFGMLGHTLLTIAHRFAEASKLAPTVYSQIVYITLLSWWVFGTTPTSNVAVGTLIIAGSGLYIWYRERKNKRHQK